MNEKHPPKGLIIGIMIALLVATGFIVFALQNKESSAPQSNFDQSDTSAGSSKSDNAAAPTPSERMTITYTDKGFEPEKLSVKKGTVVSIMNNSSRNVQFSSDNHPTHRDNSEMNLKTLSPGESELYTATVVGSWRFHDHIDETKTGEITVTE